MIVGELVAAPGGEPERVKEGRAELIRSAFTYVSGEIEGGGSAH